MTAGYNDHQLLHPSRPAYLLLLIALVLLVLVGVYCAYNMEHTGHIITGMNNQIVWGLPHVFAISLIVAASGALNGATLSSVFGVSEYKPWARLSVVLALVLLAGGLVVLVLDLGRPDRLVIALTTYNFKSIFSWNIYLYSGFMVVGVLYLWMMFERRFNRFTAIAGAFAFGWRIILTTGTGSIFGFLVGRSALDSAILAPLFIALSFVMGTAALALVMSSVARWQQAVLSNAVVEALGKLLFWSVIALVYFSVVHHLTNLYVAQHQADEKLVLSGSLGLMFWGGHGLVGVVLPLIFLRWSRLTGAQIEHSEPDGSAGGLLLASVSALVGGAILVYVIVIGSQSGAQQLFPGKTVVSSSFGDGGYAAYLPSYWEWGLGIGGVALSLLLFFLVLRILPVSPQSTPRSSIS